MSEQKRKYGSLIDGVFYTVEVVRTGRYKSSGNTSEFYIISEKNIDEIVEYANNAKQPFTIDYNHATFSNVPVTPEQTVAAGYHHNWGWEKRANSDGSFSAMAVKNTEWTQKAKQFIKNGEYRFISSVLMFDGAENENRYGAKILGSSLVPIPNIKGMDAVVLNKAKALVKELALQLNEAQEFELNFNNSILINMQGNDKMQAYLNEMKAVMEDMVGDELTEENGTAFIEKAKDCVAKFKARKKLADEKEMAEQNAAQLARKQIELMAEKATLISELNAIREKQNEDARKFAAGFEDVAVSLLAEYALNSGKITPAQLNGESTTIEVNGEKKTVVASHPIRPIFKGNFAISLQECNGDTLKAFNKAVTDTKTYINSMPTVLPSQNGTAPATPKENNKQPAPNAPAGVEFNAESVKIQAEITALCRSGKKYEEALQIVQDKYPAFFGLE